MSGVHAPSKPALRRTLREDTESKGVFEGKVRNRRECSKGGPGIGGSVRRACICLILTQNIHKLYIRDDFIVNNDILDFPGCVPIVTYEKSTLIRWRGYMSFRAAFVFFVEKRDNGKKSF